MSQQDSEQDRLIAWSEVSQITGFKSGNALRRREDKGEFPKRRYLGPNAVRWSWLEVMAWKDNLPREDIYKDRRSGVAA